MEQAEKLKASMRAKLECPFRVIRRQFGCMQARYRGVNQTTRQLHIFFAQSNLRMMRRTLLQELRE